ncbi:MAG TPA: PIG-L deacetylase family protein [Candidatus Limnocylindria bacterium]|jgi:LmbE family N-acetylglucosaminyl deacetylase|nr:PIG-L deacetylase family protein [Candidatus Limnocylindria bacterium]
MTTANPNRRNFLSQSLAAAPLLLATSAIETAPAAEPPANDKSRPLKIVCVGGHPDDPESGCAGTLARCSTAGHSVTVIYLTRGERGIKGKPLDEAARIRSAEAEAACRIMGAKAVFAGQVDGAADFTRARLEEMQALMSAENPDLIFAHWPVDTHFDHQAASMLAIRCQMSLPRRPRLYFFEVNTGSQTQGFTPNVYVDISNQVEKKKAALFAHVSQDGQGIWKEHHEVIAQFRGREAGVTAAEGFVHLSRNTSVGGTLDFLF